MNEKTALEHQLFEFKCIFKAQGISDEEVQKLIEYAQEARKGI